MSLIAKLNIKEWIRMSRQSKLLFVNVDTVKNDLGVSRAKAYQVIKELNAELKKQYPMAIVVAGKVKRIWYEEACLQHITDWGGYVCRY